MSARTVVSAVVVAVAFLVPASVAGAAIPGSLAQLPGTQSCVTSDGKLGATSGVCTAAPALGEANSMLISPDGKFAYVNGYNFGHYNIVILARDTTTGALSALTGPDYCYSEDGSGPGGPASCTNVRDLGYSQEGDSMAMTKDGANLYVGGQNTGVAIFQRDAATGKLTQLSDTTGCVTANGDSPDDGPLSCTNGRMLAKVHSVTLSPDERFVYVASTDFSGTPYAGVAIFARNTSSGALTQLASTDGCVTNNGKSEDGNATCGDIRGGAYAGNFSITPDGMHGYLADYDRNSMAILNVDPATGKISQASGDAGCLSNDGGSEDGAGTCQNLGMLDGAWTTVISPDGKTLIVGDYGMSGISSFRIDPATGALTPVAGLDHCITDTGNSTTEGPGTCQNGRGMESTERLTLSSDGTTLYVASYGKGVALVSVDPATGKVSQLDSVEGCFSMNGSSADGANTCTAVNTADGTYKLALSPDERFAYMPSDGASPAGSITAFARLLPPVCTNVSGTTPFQTPLTLSLTCSDPNGDPITREIVGQPGHGSLGGIDQATGNVTFSPATGFSGADSFTFRASDGTFTSAPATAAVTVGAAPAPVPVPIATPDKTAPSCKRTSGNTLSVRKPSVTLRCNEAATVALKLTLPAAVAKKLKISKVITIATGKATLKANSATKVKLKFTKKAKKVLLKLKAKQLKKLRPTLSFTATDAAKNKKTTSARLKLKR